MLKSYFYLLVCAAPALCNIKMAKRTVLNEAYKGLVETMSIPVELHERAGRKFASFGGVLPIHCATEEQVLELAKTTHHYCDVFTDEVLAPLAELAYVRLDENTAEKVFINRSKRILLTSSDGQLAQWRAAPSFPSDNRFLAGAPIVNHDGALVSVVTAKRGNHYAVSSFDGEGGYFDTTLPWKILDSPGIIYGDQSFPSREALRSHVVFLPPAHKAPPSPAAPVLHRSATPRIALVAGNGRQMAHIYLQGVHADGVEYL
ncbi:poxin-like isoform X2 [Cydia strobilella]|uniref:poxin-like isoform X2 n=1 Tax=Cydia strobilella TaxID=1100964 RepID=UPI00300677A5